MVCRFRLASQIDSPSKVTAQGDGWLPGTAMEKRSSPSGASLCRELPHDATTHIFVPSVIIAAGDV